MRIHPPSTLPLVAALVALQAGCRAEEEPGNTAEGSSAGTCEGGEPVVGLLRTLAFVRADADGVSEGFDLDGAVSTESDAIGCGIADYVDPEGHTGIDNAWARVQPALDLTEAAAIEGLIQSSIEAGNLLLMYQITGVDDLVNDDCVDFTVLRGTGTPMLGTDGLILSGQTFDRDLSIPAVHVGQASIVDGVLIAAPLELSIPLTVFDVNVDFKVQGGAFRVNLEDAENASGVMGGGTNIDALVEVAETNNVDAALAGIMQSLLDASADLWPDEGGVCHDISVNFEYDAVSAYFYEDTGP